MVALSAMRSDYVAAQNVDLTLMRPAQLKNMRKNRNLFEKLKNFESADSPDIPLSDEV